MKDAQLFLQIDVERWVFGTIEKVQRGSNWKEAWQETYRELGGKSDETMKKACPRKAAQTLYELGIIKNGGKERKDLPLQEVLDGYSKNGVYAVLALDELKSSPDLLLSNLWGIIQERVRNELGEDPAIQNEGGATFAFKLWHLELTV